MLAFTTKSYRLETSLRSEGEDKFFVGDVARTATRYLVKMELRGLTGVVASILGKDPPQVRYWISGAAPAFVKFEGPMFLNGPPWRIELTGPRWERSVSAPRAPAAASRSGPRGPARPS